MILPYLRKPTLYAFLKQGTGDACEFVIPSRVWRRYFEMTSNHVVRRCDSYSGCVDSGSARRVHNYKHNARRMGLRETDREDG